MRALIIGCGYVGVALGAELARRGHEVFGLRRDSSAAAELQRCGIVPLLGDVTDPRRLARLRDSYDWVVNALSSSKGGVDEYRAIYVEGTHNITNWLKPMAKYVFVSSTSVYAQNDGSAVDEQSAAEGASETSKVLVETESMLRERSPHGFPAVIIRASGIYGPERGHLFQQFLKGEATISEKCERFINMIHRDDLAGAIIVALERGRPGEIYNASDDEPVSQLEFFGWLSEQLSKPLPAVHDEVTNLPRKRGVTNKRVSNAKLKSELGYVLKFPTFREGYREEIRRLVEAS